MVTQQVVWDSVRARIVCMDSMGHVDETNTCRDVLVAASHSAVCAVELVLNVRPLGVIGHAAGPGKDDAGVSGLALLERVRIPGAAVDGTTAPISDGRGMYERGRILRLNELARGLGVEEGMRVSDAAQVMATAAWPSPVAAYQELLHDGPEGRIIALETIKHGDERINGSVICMGSHSGASMADYVESYDLRGTITNDAGQPLEESATRGMTRLAERGIPAAVVANDSARVGDGVSTYETGLLSMVNAVAEELGIRPGMAARDAALRMLSR